MNIFFKIIFLMCFSLSYSFSMADSSFYPINQIGNEWGYSSTRQTTTPYNEKITDTIRVNGTIYYKLVVNDYNGDFIRESNNKVFILNSIDSSESLLLDFSAKIGDSWQLPEFSDTEFGRCFWGGEITLISKKDTVVTPIDTFYNCYKFYHLSGCVDAGTGVSWYSKGIGKVKFISSFFLGSIIYSLENYQLITGVDDNNQNLVELNFSLSQNYPNPFNPSTKIRYSVSNSDKVMIKVYDILGKEVKTLLDRYQNAGTYEIEFDGSNLPSAVYFYRIFSKNNTRTKKMILLR